MIGEADAYYAKARVMRAIAMDLESQPNRRLTAVFKRYSRHFLFKAYGIEWKERGLESQGIQSFQAADDFLRKIKSRGTS